MDWTKYGIEAPFYQDDWVCQIEGDCLNELPKLPSDSIDLLCADPPYGWNFMGRDWDKAIPSVGVWKECLRVLKAGAFAFIMCGPRQDCLGRMIANLQDAGFRTDFTSLYWCYASGFPKAGNISKMVDRKQGIKREVIGQKIRGDVEKAKQTGSTFAVAEANKGNKAIFGYGIEDITIPATPQSKSLDGSYGGFQPKPALEVILVAMKPLSEKTFVDQALKNKKGITWLNNGRIPYKGEDNPSVGGRHNIRGRRIGAGDGKYGFQSLENAQVNISGRFPANLLCSDDALNNGRADKGTKPHKVYSSIDRYEGYGSITHKQGEIVNFGDSGSFSRYFDLDAWWQKQIEQLPESAQRTFPFLIVSKASKSEKNKGLGELPEGLMARSGGAQQALKAGKDEYLQEHIGLNRISRVKNIHPTVKPLKLLSYLITIGSRPNDVVLDPFIGSGTTAIACKILSRYCIGIEIKPDYSRINELRVAQPLQPLLPM